MNDALFPEDFYNVLQWIKAFPDPTSELVERWQGYLAESRERHSPFQYSWNPMTPDEASEQNWRESKWIGLFNNNLQTIDLEEVEQEQLIQSWDRFIKEVDIYPSDPSHMSWNDSDEGSNWNNSNSDSDPDNSDKGSNNSDDEEAEDESWC
ncbi:hypothetical protein B0H19DRAFT_1274637 [Mycena capillaripes]|nr:hypothetical protein B0H19DRAFT_1274637 [Mycena capillaripes]